MSTTLFGWFGMPGGVELIVVALIILILFGNRLPSVIRSLGQGITEFIKGVSTGVDEVTSSIDSDEKIEK